jgi:mannose-6-phosphate isomerase-like protein (cupin superfamily)
MHRNPIEEYYLVLKGTLEVEVENERYTLRPMQMLAVPPGKCHMIVDWSGPIEYLTIRAPVSTDSDKTLCS